MAQEHIHTGHERDILRHRNGRGPSLNLKRYCIGMATAVYLDRYGQDLVDRTSMGACPGDGLMLIGGTTPTTPGTGGWLFLVATR